MRRGGPASVVASLALLAALGGCLGAAPPVPRDHYYRIVVPAPQTSPVVRFPGVVSVAPLEADGLLRERPVLFSASGRIHQMQQHDYHYWTDPPPRMLQTQLVDYLRGSGVAGAVVTPELRLEADYAVTGRVKRLERLLGGGTPRVAAELELAMIETGTNRLIVVETYAAERPAGDEGVGSSILALNQALAEIFARFLADAGQRYTALRPAVPD
ncbi:MAG: ABC-type transport auxiliary lipoprotein family protein [Kiloniellaceae bacterium]